METSKLVQAFETELNLTESGLIELTELKKGLVIDVNTDDGFKLARKERTEQNKIIKNIDDLAISGKRSVDEARAVLKDRVSAIYAPIVTAFEAENIRRKEIAEQKKRDEESRINAIREQINSIREFSNNLLHKNSEELQGIIEAVDMIDVSENFAELTQDAMLVKKETLAELNVALTSSIQREQIAIEREQLEKEQQAQAEQNRVAELKAKAQERLNTLIMIPSGFFGKTSDEINKKIYSLSNYEVKQEEFGELFNQAVVSKEQVIQQLNMMFDQQSVVEKAQEDSKRVEAERIAKIKENDEELKMREHEKEQEKTTAEPKVNVYVEPTAEQQATGENKLNWHDEMIKQVNFWAKEYGIVNSEYSDLINILNQYTNQAR